MKKAIPFLVAILAAGPSLAQTPGRPDAGSPAPTTEQKRAPAASQGSTKNQGSSASQGTSTGESVPGGLVSGANSFTESQAASRMTDAGYTDVTNLKKDDNGIWRAQAKKDGKSVNVGLDFKGNIAPQ